MPTLMPCSPVKVDRGNKKTTGRRISDKPVTRKWLTLSSVIARDASIHPDFKRSNKGKTDTVSDLVWIRFGSYLVLGIDWVSTSKSLVFPKY